MEGNLEIEKIEGVRKFLIAGSRIVLVRNQKQTFQRSHYVDLIAGKGYNPTYIQFENNVYYSNYDGEVFKFSIDSSKVEKIEGIHFDPIASSDNLLIVDVKDEQGKITSAVYDLISLSKVYSTSVLLRDVIITDNYLAGLSQETNEIHFINIVSEKIWKKNVDGFAWTTKDGEVIEGKVCQIIGIYHHQLLVHLAKFLLISIDVRSGEELWRIDNFYNQINHDLYIDFDLKTQTPMPWHLDEEKGQLYLLARYYFLRIDLEQQKQFLELNFENNLSEERWNFTRTNLENNKMFFSGTKGLDFFSNRIGVLDLINYKIIWDYHSKDGSYYMQAPRQFKNNFLVMNNLKTLCVFKSVDIETEND